MGMMDLAREKDRGSASSSSSSTCEDMELIESNKIPKSCVDCKTTKTPLWRGGPAGPKSLCNACGIRYRKRRVSEKKKERSSSSQPQTLAQSQDRADERSENGESTAANTDGELSESMKLNLVALGKDLMMRGGSPAPAPAAKKQRCRRRRKMGEEEQAAVCLLAMSCGYVFA